MRRIVIVATLFLIIHYSGRAQSQNMPATHNHPSAPIIDGATHPEQISDLIAYRLWLVAVSRPPVPTDEQKKRQHLQLSNVGLQDIDEKSLVALLADFKVQYQKLIQDYNAEATAEIAHGDKPDVAAMRLQRDLLVQSTHDRIKAALKPDVWLRLDGHVQGEKKRMKINLEGGQQ